MTSTRGAQKTPEFIKHCVFILTCLNFSRLQSTLHLMQCTHWDIFPTAQSSFCTHQFCCLLVLLPLFVSLLPHWQNVSLWGLFSSWETKKLLGGEIRWIGRVGPGGHVVFGQNCWTLTVVWAGALVNCPSWNGQTHWKNFFKKFTEAECSFLQQGQQMHWSRWVPWTLTWLGKTLLQGARPPDDNSRVFWVPPCICLSPCAPL